MTARANVYEGSVYMARYLNGAWGDFQGPIESTKFAIQANAKQIDQISRGRGTFGQITESVSIQEPSEFMVTFTEGTPELVACDFVDAYRTNAQSRVLEEDLVRVGKSSMALAGAVIAILAMATAFVNYVDQVHLPQTALNANNADLLDNIDSTGFALVNHTHPASAITGVPRAP